MEVKERLKIFIKKQGISVKDFEKSVNVSNGYVNSISKSIGIEKINRILDKYPNLNIEWLLTGRGNMLKNAQSDTVVSEDEDKISDLRYIISLQKDKITRLENAVKQVEKAKRTTRKTV